MHWPVTSAAASEASHTTSGATSSGVPSPARRSAAGTGSPAADRATCSPSPGMVATIRVSAVGMTALTVTRWRSSSTAQVRTRPMMAAFDAE
jgi:hypothetical protein